MWEIWQIIKFLVKTITLLLFIFLSCYVVLFGKRKTGLVRDYIFTSLFLLSILGVLR